MKKIKQLLKDLREIEKANPDNIRLNAAIRYLQAVLEEMK